MEEDMKTLKPGILSSLFLPALSVAVTASVALGDARAQSWPREPIKVIVPISAGSAADVIPRVVFQEISARIGQPVVVENRPGAGGMIGASAVAKADADGHTLLAMSASYTILPAVHSNLPYDAKADLQPVAAFGNIPNALVVAPSKGYRTLHDLVAAAKAHPGQLNYGSVGNGTALHLNAERFRISAGIQVQHVAIRGAPQLGTEVLTGRLDFSFLPLPLALPLIREGKLHALAVGSSARASALPEVPTTAEAGFAKSGFNFWLGLFVPAKTPPDVVARLHHEVRKALQLPTIREHLAKLGVEPMDLDQQAFSTFVHQEIAANAELVRDAGITAK
jgi:tripartite-type tricarboxylate transporter receptor subunit TctC